MSEQRAEYINERCGPPPGTAADQAKAQQLVEECQLITPGEPGACFGHIAQHVRAEREAGLVAVEVAVRNDGLYIDNLGRATLGIYRQHPEGEEEIDRLAPGKSFSCSPMIAGAIRLRPVQTPADASDPEVQTSADTDDAAPAARNQ